MLFMQLSNNCLVTSWAPNLQMPQQLPANIRICNRRTRPQGQSTRRRTMGRNSRKSKGSECVAVFDDVEVTSRRRDAPASHEVPDHAASHIRRPNKPARLREEDTETHCNTHLAVRRSMVQRYFRSITVAHSSERRFHVQRVMPHQTRPIQCEPSGTRQHHRGSCLGLLARLQDGARRKR